MKFRNITFIIVAIVVLCYCKKDDDEGQYTNEQIVYTNAQTTMYLHTIFREAENAWAIVDSMEYDVAKTYVRNVGVSSSKTITYKETEGGVKTATIEYSAWNTGNVQLMGNIVVTLPDKGVYKQNGKTAAISLENNFSIQGQRVTGYATFKYNTTTNNPNDQYTYTFTDGIIYDKDETQGRKILTTATIVNGPYERIEGGSTVYEGDDIWAYTGTLTGLLNNDPNMKYTNTVLVSYTTVNNEKKSGIVHFSMNCQTAEDGVCTVVISGRPNIIYGYDCSGYDFLSITPVD